MTVVTVVREVMEVMEVMVVMLREEDGSQRRAALVWTASGTDHVPHDANQRDERDDGLIIRKTLLPWN